MIAAVIKNMALLLALASVMFCAVVALRAARLIRRRSCCGATTVVAVAVLVPVRRAGKQAIDTLHLRSAKTTDVIRSRGSDVVDILDSRYARTTSRSIGPQQSIALID